MCILLYVNYSWKKKDNVVKGTVQGNFSGMVAVGITGMDNNTSSFSFDLLPQ